MCVCPQVGSQTPTYAVSQEQAALRDRNETALKRVNDVLTQRLALEDKTRKAEAKIAEIQVRRVCVCMCARCSPCTP